MEFLKDGKLIYSFQQENKTVIMNLVYKLDGNVIISDQPSSPREERTEFCFETDDILFLRFNDNQSWFRRE